MINLSFAWLQVGFCHHRSCFAARGGGCQRVEFPALCALIFHPHRGWILFDTGYSDHFFHATTSLPECLYRLATPVTLPPSEKLSTQLTARGINVQEIKHILISHYHGDHIAGLKDFPDAQFWAWRAESEMMFQLADKPLQATLQGYLPTLLPSNFQTRLQYVDDCSQRKLPLWLHPFTTGWDIFADGSLFAIPLLGHSRVQLGLFIPSANGRPVFLIADACWSLPALRENRPPPYPVLSMLSRPKLFLQTFQQLRQLSQRERAVALLPSHCPVAREEWQNG